jgi:CheY-like chemotaxis protein
MDVAAAAELFKALPGSDPWSVTMNPMSLDQLARVRIVARRNDELAAAFEEQLEVLVHATEADVDHILASLSQVPALSPAYVNHLTAALQAQLDRSTDAVSVAKQLCVSAREHHLGASCLMADLDAPAADRAPADRPGTSAAVLVVDDYDDGRELMSIVLHEAGFTVRTASNGLEALIAAYEMRPAVIVMDVTMPVLDGIEATRLIKSIDATRDARVIAYTARPALADAIVRRWFAAVLPKPSPLEVIVATVQHCVQAA